MPHPSRAHLDAIGIPVWVRRGVARPARRAETPRIEVPRATAAITVPAAQVLETIDAQVRDCRKCGLHRERTHTVFGVGRPDAACMFIGEAPGAEEDARGEPFVGRAGKLLDAMLAAIGLGRGDVYIANIVKCRPPRNRDPPHRRDHRLLGVPQAPDRGGLSASAGRGPAGSRRSRSCRRRSRSDSFAGAASGTEKTASRCSSCTTPRTSCAVRSRSARHGMIWCGCAFDALRSCRERPMNAVARALPEITFRPMCEADLDEVLSIEREACEFPWSREIFRDCLRVGYSCRVLESDGAVNAYGMLQIATGRSRLLNLCVRKRLRRRGLGRRLLFLLIEVARSHSTDSVVLEGAPEQTLSRDACTAPWGSSGWGSAVATTPRGTAARMRSSLRSRSHEAVHASGTSRPGTRRAS